jgi:hypothetical protein
MSAIDESVESHFPKALQLGFWQLADEELLNELPELDRA